MDTAAGDSLSCKIMQAKVLCAGLLCVAATAAYEHGGGAAHSVQPERPTELQVDAVLAQRRAHDPSTSLPESEAKAAQLHARLSAVPTHLINGRSNVTYVGVHGPPSKAMLTTSIVAICVAAGLLILELTFPTKPFSECWAEARKREEELKAKAGEAEKRKNKPAIFALLEKAEETATDTDDEKEGEKDEEKIEADPNRWYYLGMIIASCFANDLYFNMPGTFFQGESAAKGLAPSFNGLYLGGGAFLTLLWPPIGAYLLQFVDAGDAQRISIFLFATLAIPQGLGNLINSATGFAVFEVGLRLLEGIPFCFVELISMTLMLRIFQRPKELTAANGTFMGIRSLAAIGSAPAGGALYSAAGMAAPYTVVGLLMICIGIGLRVFMSKAKATGGVHRNAPLLSLLKIRTFAVMLFASFVLFFAMLSMEIVWQPWLGKSGPGQYHMSPADISMVSMTMVIAMSIGAMAVGVAMCMYIGNAITLIVGEIIIMIGMLLIGAPPLAFPNLPIAPWMPFVVSGIIGLGTGLAFSAYMPICVEIIVKESGMPRKRTDGPMATLNLLLPAFALTLGPIIGGAIIQAVGPSGSTLLNAGLLVIAVALQVLYLQPYMQLKDAGMEGH
jgi:hypothetical protein